MDDWVEKPHAMFKESITVRIFYLTIFFLPSLTLKSVDLIVQNSIAARESFCGNLLFPEDGHKVDAYTEDRIKWTATSMYGGRRQS